ncbi:MAG: hypothetical protein RPS47_07390 [Colwellia sp.]
MKAILLSLMILVSNAGYATETTVKSVSLSAAPYDQNSRQDYAILEFNHAVVDTRTGVCVPIESADAIGITNRLTLDVSTPSGKAIYSMSMMALVSGKSILVTGTSAEPCILSIQLLDTISLK